MQGYSLCEGEYCNLFRFSNVPKKIWILWLQGWDNAPYIVKKVNESWIKHNPEYEIIQLSRNNIKDYIPDIQNQDKKTDQAYSDIIRLSLLEKYGGVWADSTMLCMKSLDNLVNSIYGDIWMYHGGDSCKYLASWFIVCKKNSYIMKKWKEKCDEYWKNRDLPDEYFWMDKLWIDLYNSDEVFKKNWDSFEPKICCGDIGESHVFAGKVNNKDEDLQKIISEKRPYAIKLSHHNFNEHDKENNGNFAINLSLNFFPANIF